MAVLLVTGVCDLGYTIYQGVTEEVAQYLYLSSSVLVVTMASTLPIVQYTAHTIAQSYEKTLDELANITSACNV